MPQPPGWINEFQFITSFWFNRCHHPATLYYEMAFPPTVIAADTLLAVDLPQIARTLFRPGGTRTKRHGRKANAKRRPPYTKIPDPNESVANLVRDATDVGDRVVADGPRRLWTLLDLGESVVGKFFVVGVIEQWLFNYALFIDAAAASDCGIPAVRAEGGGTETGTGGETSIAGTHTVWATGGATCNSGVVFMPAPRWMGCCSGTMTNTGSGTGGTEAVTLHVFMRNGDGQIIQGSQTSHTVGFMENVDFCSTVFFDGTESVGGIWAVYQSDGGFSHGWIVNAVIFCQAY